MRPKEARVQPDSGDPLADQPGVLSRRYRPVPTATAAEEELTRLLVGGCDVTVDGLSGLFRHREPYRLASLLLAHGCPIDSMTMGSNVFDLQADDVTSSELAIDGKIEHGQVACSPRDLQLGADRPDVLRSERRLGTDQFSFVPRFAMRGLGISVCRVVQVVLLC